MEKVQDQPSKKDGSPQTLADARFYFFKHSEFKVPNALFIGYL